jgi:hypothetical protein
MRLEERTTKDPAAVALGRKGGKKGGPARAAKLTAQERSDSARNAVQARWSNKRADSDKPNTTSKKMSTPATFKKLPTAVEFKKKIAKGGSVSMTVSDFAVLDLLGRIKSTQNLTEVKSLSAQLEELIFSKQHAR